MPSKTLKALVSKIPDALPLILLQLITIVYLIIIGFYLPTASTKQLLMKLGLMGLGVFALWKLLGLTRATRKEHEAGKDS
ncbi:MAG: hypothetical protein JKY86_08545 [Gammaproteobacteria bacterium]|nr:hypothetical protein [Gammaproteobacteria bacterium]MBL4890731.1 hypothetical protein [Rhizobiaceae bacterium]